MKRTLLMLLVSLGFAFTGATFVGVRPVRAQEGSVLDAYVRMGLDRNLALRQERLALGASRHQLSETRGARLPSLSIEAYYARAGGGRRFEFPAGDLLNPAYDALEDLLGDQGGDFPTLENQEFLLRRAREQETRLRLVQPVYQPALRHRARAQTYQVQAREASVDAARRDLVADIKMSYFDYLRAEQVVALFEATQALVDENLRVSERLVRNGKATRDAVYRAEVEVSDVLQQRDAAAARRDVAASTFNFLLNRPLDTPIERVPLDDLIREAAPAPALLASNAALPAAHDALADRALQQRDELAGLERAVAAAGAHVRLARSAFLPDLTFVLDYGIQGSGYAFSDDDDFQAASLVMSWNLFNGFQDRARVAQARLRQQTLEAQHDELAHRIRLQVQEAYDYVAVARRAVETAEARLRSAEASFRLVQRKYEEGMAPQVDFIDARTALTGARLNLALTRYDLLDRYAELERVAALYPLDGTPPEGSPPDGLSLHGSSPDGSFRD